MNFYYLANSFIARNQLLLVHELYMHSPESDHRLIN